MADVKFKGEITGETRGGGIWFLITEGPHAFAEVCFPRSEVAIVEIDVGHEITVPDWLAEEKDLW